MSSSLMRFIIKVTKSSRGMRCVPRSWTMNNSVVLRWNVKRNRT